MGGNVSGLPVGLSFLGAAWSEPALIALAYAFERRAPARLIPDLRRHGSGGEPTGRR